VKVKPQKLEKIESWRRRVNRSSASRRKPERRQTGEPPDDAPWGHGLLEAVNVPDDVVAREGNFPPRKPLISPETGKESRSTVRFADSRPGVRAESAAATSAARIPVHPDAARRREDRLRPSHRGRMG
jgi:hypothetical protein